MFLSIQTLLVRGKMRSPLFTCPCLHASLALTSPLLCRENPPKGQGHPPPSTLQQQVFIPSQTFNPTSTPLSFGTTYQIEPTTGALVPLAAPGRPSTTTPPLRFEEQRGVRVVTQDHFGRPQNEPDSFLGGLHGGRGEGLLPRQELSPGMLNNGREPFDGGIVNRTVDYSRVTMSRPHSDNFDQRGMLRGGDQDLFSEPVYERRASPPWARGTNPDVSGGLGHGGLGAGVLGVGGMSSGGPSAGVLGTGSFGGGLGPVPSNSAAVKMSVKMTIARSMLGAVIGRKGANVQQIRQMSGAFVKVWFPVACLLGGLMGETFVIQAWLGFGLNVLCADKACQVPG